jgi:hypothetical protein
MARGAMPFRTFGVIERSWRPWPEADDRQGSAWDVPSAEGCPVGTGEISTA